MPPTTFLNQIKWNDEGLVPVITQELSTGDVLMLAWMNQEALSKTVALGRAVYYSRSRAKLWLKGEESGHVQTVHDIRLDCDGDALLLKVTQSGQGPSIACHTGRHACFYKQHKDGAWLDVAPVLQDPETMYPKKK